MRRIRIVAAAAILAIACRDPLASYEPEVTVIRDFFQLEANDVRSVTSTVVYDWPNTGTQAMVTHSTTTTSAGFASITIRDGTGTLVYSATLRSSFTQETLAGVPGQWRIEVNMTGYSGTLSFRVNRR